MISAPSVLTFGEALVGYATVEDNLRVATQFSRFPGGADLNVAVGLTRLGVRTTWASVLGDDAHGDYLADAVGRRGVIPLVRRASGPTWALIRRPRPAPLIVRRLIGLICRTRSRACIWSV